MAINCVNAPATRKSAFTRTENMLYCKLHVRSASCFSFSFRLWLCIVPSDFTVSTV